jgi:hypothetical protein
LLPAGQVNDAQADVTHAYVGVYVYAKLVGAAMSNHSQHLAQIGFFDGMLFTQIEGANDTAHW